MNRPQDLQVLESEARCRRQRDALMGLTGSPVLRSANLAAELRQICEANARALEVARVSIWRYSPGRAFIHSVNIYDRNADRHSNSLEFAAADYPDYFLALEEMDVIAAHDAHNDPRTREFTQRYLGPLGITSMMDAPIRTADTHYGVVCHEHIGPQRRWTEDEQTFAVAVANLVSLAMETWERRQAEEALRASSEQNRRHMAQLERAFMQTVAVATAISEMRDPYTAGHERRVGEIAVAIGAELGLDAHRLEGLRVAGYLHDIGKMTVPAEILAKPGKLSGPEYALIQGHPEAGYDVMKGVDFPWPVAQAVLQHHERLDGSGYPQGLKGEAIVLEARILAVADVVEAMSSHRPYRPGLGIEKALAEIERGIASAYDPIVAGACLRLFREKGYSIPR